VHGLLRGADLEQATSQLGRACPCTTERAELQEQALGLRVLRDGSDALEHLAVREARGREQLAALFFW
jgi:hypothetical protein